jgi:hypothetical protein
MAGGIGEASVDAGGDPLQASCRVWPSCAGADLDHLVLDHQLPIGDVADIGFDVAHVLAGEQDADDDRGEGQRVAAGEVAEAVAFVAEAAASSCGGPLRSGP